MKVGGQKSVFPCTQHGERYALKVLKLPPMAAEEDAADREAVLARVQREITIMQTELWGLNNSDAVGLLALPIGRFEQWASLSGDIDAVEMEKISCLLGIYVGLGTLDSGKTNRANRWFTKANGYSLFAGKSPLEFLSHQSPERFHLVRRLVASQTNS